jgi:hypothetical protein
MPTANWKLNFTIVGLGAITGLFRNMKDRTHVLKNCVIPNVIDAERLFFPGDRYVNNFPYYVLFYVFKPILEGKYAIRFAKNPKAEQYFFGPVTGMLEIDDACFLDAIDYACWYLSDPFQFDDGITLNKFRKYLKSINNIPIVWLTEK